MSAESSKSSLQQTLSLEQMLRAVISAFNKIWQGRKWVVITALLGGVIALNGLWVSPSKYRAELMLAVEEGESSGWQNLLAQFGLDVGGLNPGGIFEGESLVKLFTTRYMVERTLLDPVFVQGDSVSLVNFIYPYTKWGKSGKFKEVIFPDSREDFSALQDSLLFEIQDHVKKDVLDVYKPDKKLSLIFVNCTHQNKYFAQAFSEAIVKNTTTYFLESITAKARVNLQVLQNQRDSAESDLQRAIVANAVAQDNALNSIFQKNQIDKYSSFVELEIANALFIEITKNLTLAEIGLRKQTPLIQVIERPDFPLKKTGFEWWKWMLAGMGLGAVIGAYLALTRMPKA